MKAKNTDILLNMVKKEISVIKEVSVSHKFLLRFYGFSIDLLIFDVNLFQPVFEIFIIFCLQILGDSVVLVPLRIGENCVVIRTLDDYFPSGAFNYDIAVH